MIVGKLKKEVMPPDKEPVICNDCGRSFTPYYDEYSDLEDSQCVSCRINEDMFDSWASHEFGDK